jgi:hypothetical protein
MKKIILGSLLSGFILFSACEKKVEHIDSFDVTVEYRNSGPKTVTDEITVNPKDSIYFDFTITSGSDMSYVEIQKNGVTRVDTFRLSGFADKKTFSLKKVTGPIASLEAIPTGCWRGMQWVSSWAMVGNY